MKWKTFVRYPPGPPKKMLITAISENEVYAPIVDV